MWPAIAISLFLLAILAAAYRVQNEEYKKDGDVMHHTIDINLEILHSELVTLNEIASQAPQTATQQQALVLLKEAAEASATIRERQPAASNEELGELLGVAFSAMNKSTEARRLLNACKP